MLPFKLIYSHGYYLNLGNHIFAAVKYRKTHDRLLESHVASPEDFIEPRKAQVEDITLVHTRQYFQKISTGRLTEAEVLRLEIPCSREVYDTFMLCTGGSIMASRQAQEDGVCINLGGGFHHAYPDHGEGFCMINDVAVAVRKMQKEGRIRRAVVVDCDLHQGNGTAAIFREDETVYTFSIHQEDNYPMPKEQSDLDIGLEDGTGDDDYLKALQSGLHQSLKESRADMVFYLAGADPYVGDQLGGLGITLEGLKKRDTMVLQRAKEAGLPVMVTLAGGYAYDVSDTIEIHCNTVRSAREVFGPQLFRVK